MKIFQGCGSSFSEAGPGHHHITRGRVFQRELPRHDARALSVAVAIRTTSGGIGIRIPDTPHTVRIPTRAAGDAAGRVVPIRKAPTDDAARILLTYEVGTKGVGRARGRHPNAPPAPS